MFYIGSAVIKALCSFDQNADSVCCRCDVSVAKRKSLFDDKAVEIEELTYIIKQVSWFSGELSVSLHSVKCFHTDSSFCLCLQDINSLNKQIAQLQDLVRSRGAPGGRHIQTHSNTIVVSLQVAHSLPFRLHRQMEPKWW